MASVGIVTVRHLEAAKKVPRHATLDVIRRAFENAGVIFIREDESGGPGVRLVKPPSDGAKKDVASGVVLPLRSLIGRGDALCEYHLASCRYCLRGSKSFL
jgi:hypothetical protein